MERKRVRFEGLNRTKCCQQLPLRHGDEPRKLVTRTYWRNSASTQYSIKRFDNEQFAIRSFAEGVVAPAISDSRKSLRNHLIAF